MAITYNVFIALGLHFEAFEAIFHRHHFLCMFPHRMRELRLESGPGDEVLIQGQEFGILRGGGEIVRDVQV